MSKENIAFPYVKFQLKVEFDQFIFFKQHTEFINSYMNKLDTYITSLASQAVPKELTFGFLSLFLILKAKNHRLSMFDIIVKPLLY